MALEGTLGDMPLVDLIQIFKMGPKTGVLRLASGTERGVIYVSAGRLIDAVLVRGAERSVLATAEEAVLQLLQWDEATFVFEHDRAVADRKQRIVQESEWLVMEGLRRQENPLRMLPHQQITIDSRLALAALPSSAETGVKLDLDQWRILSQVAISQDVREICAKTGMLPADAIRTVTELAAIGLLDVVNPPPQRERRSAPAAAVPQLRPVAAGIGPVTPAASAGRSLLQAIMRRVRGL